MKVIPWLRKIDNLNLVLTLILGALTAAIAWLAWLEQRKASISQPAIVESYSNYYSKLKFLKGGNALIVTICRTELYVSNRGGTDSLIKVLQTNLVPNFYPDVNLPEIKLVSTIQHHLDISAFQVSGVRILAAFHNWGREAPELDDTFQFYQTDGQSILNQVEDLNETPSHLAYLGSPFLYGELTSSTSTVTAPPIAITTFDSQKSGYSFLDKHSKPITLAGQKLEKLVLDHVISYNVKPAQTKLFSTTLMPISIEIKAFFIDKGKSSNTARCAPRGQFPIF